MINANTYVGVVIRAPAKEKRKSKQVSETAKELLEKTF